MMQFSATSDKSGLIQSCESECFGDNGYGKITGNSNLLYTFTNLINRAYDRFTYLAMISGGKWQWDDTNNTDYPIATTNLVSGQRDYPFALEHLEIQKVLIADAAGKWHLLTKTVDVDDINDPDFRTYIENNTGNTGQPFEYAKVGNSIVFNSVPNYSVSGGIQVYFNRGPNYFVSTDTTKVPGIPSIFHNYLSLNASMNYATSRGLSIAGGVMRGGFRTGLLARVGDMEDSIKNFYSMRNRDQRSGLRINNYDSNR